MRTSVLRGAAIPMQVLLGGGKMILRLAGHVVKRERIKMIIQAARTTVHQDRSPTGKKQYPRLRRRRLRNFCLGAPPSIPVGRDEQEGVPP
jgi:hypothetical protein